MFVGLFACLSIPLSAQFLQNAFTELSEI